MERNIYRHELKQTLMRKLSLDSTSTDLIIHELEAFILATIADDKALDEDVRRWE